MQRRVRVAPRFYLFLILVLALICLTSFMLASASYKSACSYTDELLLERYNLSERASTLTEQLSYVGTDDYVMRTARDELNMVLPGEYRYIPA